MTSTEPEFEPYVSRSAKARLARSQAPTETPNHGYFRDITVVSRGDVIDEMLDARHDQNETETDIDAYRAARAARVAESKGPTAA
ncbi:hypothetical protein CH260_12710 [Rhodococcus sp. 05-2256-B2]|nr:hypothetical protein CH258_18215 [Rhodococcus sp. 05-2256-B4]OZD96172.1 hypothetical protein CH260_12710 [Rhodococcus sp. 05-2256-B2]OZD96594.1 hypothetical protein CH257_04870 [Rhodococcus sp. 05-2256-B3]OZD99570.1 hypothetical protein CH285_20820 [Rhodococcus sp. 05-2256-B1]